MESNAPGRLPLVSVVMPVHNGENYLREAMDSILAQTYENLEVVVVDDASTDRTYEILEEYAGKDARVKVQKVEKQPALGNVLNIGIRASTGKYIARMDHDDVTMPDRIAVQVAFMESHPDVVVVGGQVELIDKDGDRMRGRAYPEDDRKLKRNLFLFGPFAHPAVMMRRDALERSGGYPEGLRRSVEDIKLWFLMAREGKFANVPETILRYRISYASLSQENMVDHFAETEAVRVWAVKELGYEVDLRSKIIWNLEKFGVQVLRILPPGLFLWVFEVARRVFG